MSISLHDTRFRMGRVVTQTFGVIGRNPVGVLLLCFAVAVLGQFVAYGSTLLTPLLPGTSALYVPRVLGFLIGVALHGVLLGSVTAVAVGDLNGRRVSAGAALAVGLRLMGPVVAISLIAYVLGTLGLVLLVVPGILLFLRWAVAVPARVVEGPGIKAALGRSAVLTRGHRWALLALVLCYVLLVGLGIGILVVVDGGFLEIALAVARHDPATIGIQVVTNTLLAALSSAGAAAAYLELRRAQEGGTPENLAGVFE